MLYPIQNNFRDIIDISGLWKFKADPLKIGEKGKWFEGFESDCDIAVPGSWNEQLEENREHNFEWSNVVLAQRSNRLHPIDSAQMGILKDEDEEIFKVNEGDPNGHLGYIPSNQICPCCKAASKHFRHLRFSSGFFNRCKMVSRFSRSSGVG